MPEPPRKTLNDYLLKGGIKGKLFEDPNATREDYPGVYRVTAIDIEGFNNIVYLTVDYMANGSMDQHFILGQHLRDQEASPKKIEIVKDISGADMRV